MGRTINPDAARSDGRHVNGMAVKSSCAEPHGGPTAASMTELYDVPSLSVVTLVNDEVHYSAMRASLDGQFQPGGIEWIPVRPDPLGWNAAMGLNAGLDMARGAWVACAHQDVRFPDGWWGRALAQLNAWRGRVGVAGLVGTTYSGRFVGHVLDPHGHHQWGRLPAVTVSLDEHVVLIRRESGLRFDPANPGFHCYGTDMAQAAQEREWDAVVIDAPVWHLSAGSLNRAFDEAADWLLQKWGRRFDDVIPTCATVISRKTLRNAARRLRVRWNRRRSRRSGECRCRLLDPLAMEVAR